MLLRLLEIDLRLDQERYQDLAVMPNLNLSLSLQSEKFSQSEHLRVISKTGIITPFASRGQASIYFRVC